MIYNWPSVTTPPFYTKFADFEVEHPGQFDYVEITDGDGSRLGRFSADQNGNLPNVTSNTETVHVLFHSDEETAKKGWRLEWSKY